MKKYNIEGGLDFFDELYKSLDCNESIQKNKNDDQLCLISNEILKEHFFEMSCGHKFNYIPLFKDILNHKKKFNYMESNTTRLSRNEIRCPYCRHKHNGLLPYYEDIGVEKVDGVNYYDPNYKVTIIRKSNIYKNCDFLIINPNFNPNIKEDELNKYNKGNCKYLKCWHLGSQIEKTHYYNLNDDKYYCWYHKKKVIKKYKKDQTDKIKQDYKEKKLKEKEEAKQIKEQAKKTLKLSKLNNNLDVNFSDLSNIDENVIINNGCMQILKTGINKGKSCGCKFFMENLCKRHYNSKNKSSNQNTKQIIS
jgi:hypothetical protein